ncbi:hypothetical protein PV768_16145 [Pseudarthrobacter sp. CC4]
MGSGHEHSHGGDAAGQRGKLIIVFGITFTVMIADSAALLIAASPRCQ